MKSAMTVVMTVCVGYVYLEESRGLSGLGVESNGLLEVEAG